MSAVPPSGWQPLSGAQRDFLARWLRARQLELRLREAGPPVSAPQREISHSDRFAVTQQVAAYDPGPLEAGEIRLLSPRFTPDAERPVYVAVFRDWEDGWKLVAPFGPFDIPGTTGELLLDRKADTLRVLCLWNTHSLPADAPIESWLIDKLSAAELDDAWAVFRHVATGAKLPKNLVDRVGPALAGPEDPRIAYQDEEMALMQPVAEMAEFPVDPRRQGILQLTWRHKAVKESLVKLRARVPEMPKHESMFVSADPALRIRVTLQSDWKTCSVLVLDPQGEASTALDGGSLTDFKGDALARISGSQAVAPLDRIARGFGIKSAAGQPLALTEAQTHGK